jgi:hypothetical protein
VSGPSGWEAAAVALVLLCLTTATLFFAVSVYMYMYDLLTMPPHYWDNFQRRKRPPQDVWRSFDVIESIMGWCTPIWCGSGGSSLAWPSRWRCLDSLLWSCTGAFG